MIEYDQYYYRHGIRKYEYLDSPPCTALTEFELPYHSLFHYLPQTENDVGPKYGEIWFQSVGGQRFVDHVVEMASQHGTPIWAKQQASTFIQRFRKEQTQFKRLTDIIQATGARTNLLIENYAILPHLWQYRDNYMSTYNQWRNLRETLWSNVLRLTERLPEQHQFIVLDISEPVPTLADFKLAAQQHNRTTLKRFNTPDLLDLLELYVWVGNNRQSAPLGKLADHSLTHVNIVFNVGGYWTLLNLGVLNQWIKGHGVGSDRDIREGRDATLLQKKMLAFFNRLYTVRSTAARVGSETGYSSNTATLPESKEDEQVIAAAAPAPIKVDIDSLSALGVNIPSAPLLDFNFDAVLPDPVQEETIPVIPVRVKDLETGERIVKTFWDLDRPPEDLNEIIQPIVSEITAEHGDELGQYDLGVLGTAAEYHESGLITNAEFARFERLAGKYRELSYDGSKTIAEVAVIEPATLKDVGSFKLPDIPTVVDKSMLESTLSIFDKNYINNVLQSDIANMLLAPQRAGFALTAFTRERVETCMDKSDLITVSYTPVDGERTVLKMTIPVIEPNGSYMINGVKYYLKKQRVDMPIRKVAPNKVALTSYYGKTFIWRSDRVVNDYGAWLLRELANAMKKDDNPFSEIHFGQGVSTRDKAPRVLTTLGSTYRTFNRGQYMFRFTFDERDWCPKECYAEPEVKFPIALLDGVPILVDRQNECWRWDDNTHIGSIEDILGLNHTKAPLDVAEIAVFGKRLPMGIVLAYHYGIEALMERLDAKPVIHPVTARPKLTKDEYIIRFSDCLLVLSRTNRLATMVLAGFLDAGTAVTQYAYTDFNSHDAILNVLDSKGLSGRYLQEIDNQFALFLDHIARGLLADMGEPTEFGPLLIRAAQLLLTDDCPDETDLNHQRLAGYERVAGAIYRELSKSIRSQRNKRKGRRGVIELRPDAVQRRIQSDGSSQIIEDSTPIHNLKEQEAVTTGGDGGRSARSMVRRTRVYNPNDLGTISEATVDSSSVAINTSMVSNPKFTSLRGTTDRYRKGDGIASLMSTTSLLSPGGDRDDPKRRNFSAIQHSASIATDGYRPSPVCTGMENVVAHRVTEKFATTAKGTGRIVDVNQDAIVVEYDDPALGTERVPVGLQKGIIAGMHVPHYLVTDLKVGDTVKPLDALSYNSSFFSPDPLIPGQVIYKASLLMRTLLIETPDTLEDSSAISERVSKLMTTSVTYPKVITVSMGEVVHELVQPGTHVDIGSILCIVENPITANAGLFDDETYAGLAELAKPATRSEVAGTVDNIEVYYNGDPDSFNESLGAIIRNADKRRAQKRRNLGTGAMTGRVSDRNTIEGKNLQPGQVAIIVNITARYEVGVGDKGVIGHQLKTTIGRVLSGTNTTEDGVDIDYFYGYTGVSDRIVGSPEALGTTNTLALRLGELVVEAYRK